MTMFERIIIALFAFSLVGVTLNASGIFDDPLPTQDMNTTKATIEEISQDTSVHSADQGWLSSITGTFKLIGKSISFLKELIYSTLNINGLMAAYFIPSYIITMIYGMMLLAGAFMILKWYTGRQ